MFAEAAFKLIQILFGGGFLEGVKVWLKYTPQSFGRVDDIVNLSNNVTVPVASVLICIYFLIDLSEQITMDRFNTDQFLKMLIKLAFGEFLISNATGFALQFMNIGYSFVNSVSSTLSTSDLALNLKTTVDDLKDVDLGTQISVIVLLFIPAMGALAIKFSLYMSVISRILDMTVRAIAAPIGVSDIMRGGTNSAGIRYLKKCLAISLQGGIMLIVLLIGESMLQYLAPGSMTLDAEGLGNIVKYMAGLGAIMAAMQASKSICNDICGV